MAGRSLKKPASVKPVQYRALLTGGSQVMEENIKEDENENDSQDNFNREKSPDAPKKKTPHFYVHCDDDTCGPGGLQPGKLRVRCADCREGSLVVHVDPTCWDDVLTPGFCHLDADFT